MIEISDLNRTDLNWPTLILTD